MNPPEYDQAASTGCACHNEPLQMLLDLASCVLLSCITASSLHFAQCLTCYCTAYAHVKLQNETALALQATCQQLHTKFLLAGLYHSILFSFLLETRWAAPLTPPQAQSPPAMEQVMACLHRQHAGYPSPFITPSISNPLQSAVPLQQLVLRLLCLGASALGAAFLCLLVTLHQPRLVNSHQLLLAHCKLGTRQLEGSRSSTQTAWHSERYPASVRLPCIFLSHHS